MYIDRERVVGERGSVRERETHTHTRTHSEGSENRNENREQHVPQTRGEKSEARSTKKCMQYRRLAQPSTDLSTFVLRLPRYFEYRAGGWDHKSIVQEFQGFCKRNSLRLAPCMPNPGSKPKVYNQILHSQSTAQLIFPGGCSSFAS